MFKLCLSPSQQSGTEEKLIYPIAERLHAILTADNLIETLLLPLYSGTDESSLWQAIQASNEWEADYHLAIHADAVGIRKPNVIYARGTSGLYYSEAGEKFIMPIYEAMRSITPWEDAWPRRRTDLGELKNTIAVAGLIELSFYDNPEEFAWMQNNVNLIADTLRMGIYKAVGVELPTVDYKTMYFDLKTKLENIIKEM